MAMIKSITKRKITTESLYNLSVAEDESYVAGGIVVHNCKSWIRPLVSTEAYEKALKKANQEEPVKLRPSSKKIEESIQFSECGHDHIHT